MKLYTLNDFSENKTAWVIFRGDTIANIAGKQKELDIYLILGVPHDKIIAMQMVETELSAVEAKSLLKQAIANTGKPTEGILFITGDPANPSIESYAKELGISCKAVPKECLDTLTSPLKKEFGKRFSSPSSIGYNDEDNESHAAYQEIESAKKMIPDSYDLCPCASGQKYKFCCKKIFTEIMEAMIAYEDGEYEQALSYIAKAKKRVGETAEILCREAIIYEGIDPEKFNQLLERSLEINPRHPRVHYIKGLCAKQKGNYQEAIKEYQLAIDNYPETDHYHLNETYNNLGSVYYKLRQLDKAKATWEKALLYLPTDPVARENLNDFIYKNNQKNVV